MSSEKHSVVITTPVFNHSDGVGHDVEGMARALLAAGHPVHVFAALYSAVHETWRCEEGTIRELLQRPETILVHHHSIDSELLQDVLASAASRVRVMRYHNVTPPEFFTNYDASWVRHTRAGRLATVEVVRRCTHYLVPSLYNARDLVHAGADVDRLFHQPYFHKLRDFDTVVEDPLVAQKLDADTRLKVLFLGRRVPNKGHLHLVRTIGQYKRLFDAEIVLHLVGASDPSLARYDEEIRNEIRREGLEGQVVLHDKTSFAGIVAFYRRCDVFLCLSQHEGFCIPIIEAEYCGLPVVAHYRRGVPEALGPTQPWSTALDYRVFAEHLRDLRIRPEEAARLGEAGAASVRRRFDPDSLRHRFLEWFGRLDPSTSAPTRVASPRLRVAFVVQRFGADVSGGAEAIARMFAARCSDSLDITVVTTNSSTLDWDSSLRISEEPEKRRASGYRIVRLPPEGRRNGAEFEQATRDVCEGRIDIGTWFRLHGPDVPLMADYLSINADSFDVIVNWTYLFSNSHVVSRLAGKVPIVTVPFFHDEVWLRLPGMAEVVRSYDAYVFQTEAERTLGITTCDLGRKPAIVLGSGINEEAADKATALLSRPSDSSDTPYIVYVGRVEPSKGVHILIENFQRYKQERPGPLKLRIIGRTYHFALPDDPDIEQLGFVSEAEKFEVIAGAVCLVNSSELESFSLVLLESWAVGRPVLVNGRSAAMRSQVAQSGGGLAYDNYREFEWALDRLLADPSAAATLGRNGTSFYRRNYRWQKVVPRFVDFLMKVRGLGGPSTQARQPAPNEAPRVAVVES